MTEPYKTDRWRSFDRRSFQERLNRRFGLNRFAGPKIKLVYGGEERETKADGRDGLKYHRVFGKLKFTGLRQEGLLLLPRYEREEFGNEHWIIERHEEPKDPRFPRGRYTFYYQVEDERGDYREPGQDTLEHIAECLAGEDEANRQLDLELARMAKEEDEDLERNAAGLNLPYNPGLPNLASPRQ